MCATRVRVNGFRRVFNQRSTWRAQATDADAEAVLNRVREEGLSMNAILLNDLSQREYAVLRDRDLGYRMVEVEEDEIEAYFWRGRRSWCRHCSRPDRRKGERRLESESGP